MHKLSAQFLIDTLPTLEVLEYPNPLLKKISAPMLQEEVLNDEFKTTVMKMFHTMYRSRGIGLAAPQVGILKRFLVIDLNWKHLPYAYIPNEYDEDKDPIVDNKKMKDTNIPLSHLIEKGDMRVYINPEIVSSNGEMFYGEGCLSVPGYRSDVKRAKNISLKYRDLDFKEQIEEFSELDAVCLQHEIDHLNGQLFIDRISFVKRERITKKILKSQREQSRL